MRQSSVQRQATVRTNSPQWIWSLRAAGLEAFEAGTLPARKGARHCTLQCMVDAMLTRFLRTSREYVCAILRA